MLGLCTLISAAPSYPGLVEECAQQIVPSLLLLFDGLKRAYAAKAAEDENSDSDGEDDESGEEVLSSDEDDIDQDSQEYMERLQVKSSSFLYTPLNFLLKLQSFQERISKASGKAPFPITTVIKDLPAEDEEEEDSEDDDDEEEEETALEGKICLLWVHMTVG